MFKNFEVVQWLPTCPFHNLDGPVFESYVVCSSFFFKLLFLQPHQLSKCTAMSTLTATSSPHRIISIQLCQHLCKILDDNLMVRPKLRNLKNIKTKFEQLKFEDQNCPNPILRRQKMQLRQNIILHLNLIRIIILD